MDEIFPEFCSFSLLFLQHLMLRLVERQGGHGCMGSVTPSFRNGAQSPVANPRSSEGGCAATETLLHPVLYGFGLECGVMNGYDVSWVPTRHKTLT
jgi:hypothetical protein